MTTQKNHISSCSLSLHKLKGQASPIVFLYILLVNSLIDTELYKEKEKIKERRALATLVFLLSSGFGFSTSL